jgi:hypothetical protein
VLVVIGRTDEVGAKSVRNLPGVHVISPDQLNTYDVLNSDDVVFSVEALDAFIARTRRGGGRPDGNVTDPRDIILAPVISEKSYGLIEDNVHVPGAPGLEQDRDQDRDREDLRRQGRFGEHAEPAGQAQAHPLRHGKRKDTKRAIVTLAAGHHRHLRSPAPARETEED